MTRYEAAAMVASSVVKIRTNTKPWSLANAVLSRMCDDTNFTHDEVLKVRAFLHALRVNNTGADAEKMADAVRALIEEIEPGAVID